MKIMSMDCETRGLFGEIFLLGSYDGEEYRTFYSGLEYLDYLLAYNPDEDLHVFCFNLEFDLSKIMSEVNVEFEKTGNEKIRIDFNKSLIINNKFHIAKIENRKIFFRDLFPIVQSSLDDACRDFNLTTKKLDLDVKDKEKWFKNVCRFNIKLHEYLKNDVLATYELFWSLLELSKLSPEDFLKCPTIASLAMKIYKTFHYSSYEKIKESRLLKAQEDLIRQGYFGGRVEIFKNRMELGGYHYDVNSLYPYVMENYEYPVGHCYTLKKHLDQDRKMKVLDIMLKNPMYSWIMKAKVHVPEDQHIGCLPKRDRGLIFPVGVFISTFCSPEIIFAVKNLNVKILEIYDLVWWGEKAPLFTDFIAEQKKIKLTSEGAKKHFSKRVQNSLYGKFGMKRERVVYERYEEKRCEKIKLKTQVARISGFNGSDMISYNKLAFADYIRPYLSAFITSYARLELLKMMLKIGKDNLYYCDTDSIVSAIPFDELEVNEKEYGKWKLEREIEKAVFVLPKLYAEVEKNGKEILKSKGVVKEYQDNVKYDDYLKYYSYMTANENLTLYGHGAGNDKKYYYKRKIITAMIGGKNLDEKVIIKKQFFFSLIHYKRIYDYVNNVSYPFIYNENIDILEAEAV